MDKIVFIGLGNPGPHYACTRHNAGFLVVDEFLNTGKKNWKPVEQRKAKYIMNKISLPDKEIILVKPQTFMNLSGEAVGDILSVGGVSLSQLVIVYDDFSIPAGTIRLRKNGSSGGQKGMESIINTVNSSKIKRIRIGIGPLPENTDIADFVLSEFDVQQKVKFLWSVSKAVEAMHYILHRPFESAMNKYNGVEFEEEGSVL